MEEDENGKWKEEREFRNRKSGENGKSENRQKEVRIDR